MLEIIFDWLSLKLGYFEHAVLLVASIVLWTKSRNKFLAAMSIALVSFIICGMFYQSTNQELAELSQQGLPVDELKEKLGLYRMIMRSSFLLASAAFLGYSVTYVGKSDIQL